MPSTIKAVGVTRAIADRFREDPAPANVPPSRDLARSVEYRFVPGTGLRVSTISLSFPSASTPVEAPAALSNAGLIQWANQAGITFFDAIWRDSLGDIVQAMRASNGGRRELLTAIGIDPRSPEALPVRTTMAPAGLTFLPMVRGPDRTTLRSAAFARGIERTARNLHAPGWGVAWRSASEAAIAAPDALDAGARLLALPVSLIGFAEAQQVGLLAKASGAGVLGMDPMASGSLDGSFLIGSVLDGSATSRPPTIRELSTRMAPVTRLGFLTDGRRRTLAQAAACFVLGLPAVVSVSCQSRTPKTIDELAHLDRIPPLSEEELDRLARLGPMTG